MSVRLTAADLAAAAPAQVEGVERLIRGALELVRQMDRSDLPPARGGAHAGAVIERDGDYFGRTVNVAARTAAQATPGQVLASEALARSQASDLRFRPIGGRELKGIGSVPLFEVAWAG